MRIRQFKYLLNVCFYDVQSNMENIIQEYIQIQMSKLFSKTTFDKKIYQYLSTQQRVNDLLCDMTISIRVALRNNLSLSALYSSLQKTFQQTKEKYNKEEYFPMLKLTMLMHSLLLQKWITTLEEADTSQKMLELITNILNRISNIQSRPNIKEIEDNNNFLKTTIHHYAMYLQKKIQSVQMLLEELIFQKSTTDNKNQQNKISSIFQLKQMKEGTQPWKELEKYYQKCYISINSINNCAKIGDKLSAITRYFGDKYQFIIDFNLLLVKELNPKYLLFREEFANVKKIQSKGQLESSQYLELLSQIQKINEKLFIIFLNRYNYYHLSYYTPRWIDQSGKTKSQSSYQPKIHMVGPSLNHICVTNPQLSTNPNTSADSNITHSDLQIPAPNKKNKKSLRQIEGSVLLKDLTFVFKRSLTGNEQVKLNKTTRVKKSRSFYQTKMQ